MDIPFETAFDPRHGEAVPVAPGILRVTAPNAGAFTFTGTNSYILGERSVVVVDPGPDDDGHLGVLLGAVAGRTVDAILLTHTHRDHTALVARFRRETGSPPVVAEGPHRAFRPPLGDEAAAMDSAGDMNLVPDRTVGDGERLVFPAVRIEGIGTPGHTANHMAFGIDGTGVVLTGDHVMGWSTTIVAPPDGAMAPYMASLDKLLEREDKLYLPGHGGAITRPRQLVRGLRSHRRMREAAILEVLRGSASTIPEIVALLYRQTDPRLHRAAGLSVLAHLEDLAFRGRVAADGPPRIDTRFRALGGDLEAPTEH